MSKVKVFFLMAILILGSLVFGEVKEIKLVMWQHGTGLEETDFYRKRIEDFNKAYKGKIKVEFVVIERGGGMGYEEKVNIAAASGDLPDIMALDGPYTAVYAEAGILRPLDDLIDKNSKDFQDFVPSIVKQGTWNGKLYALGAMESSVAIYYNKKMFKEAGITNIPTTVDKAWTWDQFYNVCKKLKAKYPLAIVGLSGGLDEWLTYMATPFVWSNGGDIISPDGFKAEGYLNSPQTIEALAKVQQLFKEGLTTWDPGGLTMEEGEVPMMLSGPWGAIILKNYPNIDWGIIPLPKFKVHASPTGSWQWGITTKCKYPQAAIEVIKWMTNKESVRGLCEVTNMLPARKSVIDSMAKFRKLPLSVLRDQLLKSGHPRPSTPVYLTLTVEFQKAYKAIMEGEDPKTVLDNAAKSVDRYIERVFKK